ncbi:hypothetical protein AB1I62_09140 [Enterococcus sp. AN402]|uniref:hypothetical protein n=1 Tax=Enterococcus sp. AN402 TaxID=3151386 RepID=UPI00345B321A
MTTNFTFLGEPIKKDEFIQHYMLLFTETIKKIYAIDTFFPKEIQYLEAEKQKITLLYDQFVQFYHRAPDYAYLSDTLTTNFLAKEYLFASHDQNLMSANHFATLYIDQLKSKNRCTYEKYGEDWCYILQREHHRTKQAFEKHNQAIEGYPELRIQNNSFLQQQIWATLDHEFQEIYRGYERNHVS